MENSPGSSRSPGRFQPRTPGNNTATPRRSGFHQSRFFKDLSSPVRLHDLSSVHPAQSQSQSPRGALGGPEPLPPPITSLYDRLDQPLHASPPHHDFRPLLLDHDHSPKPPLSPSPSPAPSAPPLDLAPSTLQPQGGLNFEDEDSPFYHYQQPQQKLLCLPPPMEMLNAGRDRDVVDMVDEQQQQQRNWVTVYGFTRQHINSVLREFEKCGTILKHVPGPLGANWMNILYQDPYDVRRALQKHGLQITSSLMVGVKPLDSLQSEAVTEKAKACFMVMPARSPSKVSTSRSSVNISTRPYYLQPSNESGHHMSGTIAIQSGSTLSRVVDFIFGM